MDPSKIRALLDKHEDIITPAVQKDEQFFSNLVCPVCSSRNCEKKIKQTSMTISKDGEQVMKTPFSSGGILPDGNGFCPDCNTEFDPYTRLVLSTEASMIAEPM